MGDGSRRRTDRAERGDQITRPDRTMRGFGRVGRRTDFGERTSRLIFMSSSHDLSTPRVVSKAPAQFVPPHSLLRCLFCGKDFFGGSALGEFGESAGEKKAKLFPRRPSILLGKTIFSRPNIWSHTDPSLPDSLLPRVLFP